MRHGTTKKLHFANVLGGADGRNFQIAEASVNEKCIYGNKDSTVRAN